MSRSSYCSIEVAIRELPKRTLQVGETSYVEIRTYNNQVFPGVIAEDAIERNTKWVFQVLAIGRENVTLRLNLNVYNSADEIMDLKRGSQELFKARSGEHSMSLRLVDCILR